MSPAPRALRGVISLPLVVLLAGVCGAARAQNQSPPAEQTKKQSAPAKTETPPNGPKKPVHKPDWEKTKDPVVLLGEQRRRPAMEAPPATTPAEDENAAADEKAKRTAEIASLEQQVKDKQKKVALMMRLFVDDERPFLNNPENPKAQGIVQDRRQYEQDELLWETSELAKLKAKLNELKAGKPEEVGRK
jgi:hypothetical protein